MILIALAVASTLGTQPPVKASFCPNANTTIEMNDCLTGEVTKANRILNRYRSVARTEIVKDHPSDYPDVTILLKDFDNAQAKWLAYKTASCDAVHTYWKNSIIRSLKFLLCEIGMVKLHTHKIWLTWLVDEYHSTPALPEPEVEAGL